MTEAHHRDGSGREAVRASLRTHRAQAYRPHVEVESNGNKDRSEVEGLWYRVSRPWVDVVAMEDLALGPWMPLPSRSLRLKKRSGFL
jgi:hypothetical protein